MESSTVFAGDAVLAPPISAHDEVAILGLLATHAVTVVKDLNDGSFIPFAIEQIVT